MRSRVASCPKTRTMPVGTGRRVVMQRIAVVLPAPLGPSSPNTSPSWTERSRPSTAVVSPKA